MVAQPANSDVIHDPRIHRYAIKEQTNMLQELRIFHVQIKEREKNVKYSGGNFRGLIYEMAWDINMGSE